MRGYVFFILFAFFGANSAQATTHYLLLAGGHSQPANFYGFYNEVRHAYETLKAAGESVRIIAADGSWKISEEAAGSKKSNFSLTDEGRQSPDPNSQNIPTYPPIDFPAKSLSDLERAVKSLQLQPGDQLVIYTIGHGENGKDNKPQNTILNFWGKKISWQDIGSSLKKNVPSSVSVKFAVAACYGGGVHSISRTLPNVCSVAFAPYFSEGLRKYEESMFGESFWNAYRGKYGDLSFAKLAHSALSGDIANSGLGQISSFDYVDFVLKTGAYAQPYKNEPLRNRSVVNRKGESIYQRLPPKDYAMTLQPFRGNEWQEFYLSAADANKSTVEILAADIERAKRLLPFAKESFANQPIFLSTLKDLIENESVYKADLALYEKTGDLYVRPRTFHKFVQAHDVLNSLEKLEEFWQKSKPEEKQKFLSLLACEWNGLAKSKTNISTEQDPQKQPSAK